MNKLALLKQYLLTKYGRTFSSKQAVAAYQDKKIKKHLTFVTVHSPFFKKYYRDYQAELRQNQWRSLPIIDKAIMMDHFDDFNTVGLTKEHALHVAFKAEKTRDFSPKIGDISVGLSSGTSGHRGIFLVSDQESDLWAGTILAKVLPRSIFRKHSIAFFLRANNNLYSSTQNSRIAFHFFDLLDDFSSHIRKLNQLQPTIVIAPPSMLRKIAEWQQNGDISITPKKIVSVAEVLEDLDQQFIELIFEQTLHQIYQCTEGFLATTCIHGTLHMNEDLIVVEKEYVDEENGIFVPIITDFSRITQPIIRYRLNDLLIERKTPCPCGSPFLALERIDGRCDDLFYGIHEKNGELIPLFPDFIRRAIIFASSNITEYNVTQKTLELIEVKVVTKNNDAAVQQEVTDELHKLWEHHHLVPPTIEFAEYDLVPSDKKRKRIENEMRGVSSDSTS